MDLMMIYSNTVWNLHTSPSLCHCLNVVRSSFITVKKLFICTPAYLGENKMHFPLRSGVKGGTNLISFDTSL